MTTAVYVTAKNALPDHTQLPDSDGTFVKNFQEHPQSILLTESIWSKLEQLHLMSVNERGHYEIPPLGVELGLWQGVYKNVELPWLRWWDNQGKLLPTPEEVVIEERQRVEQERQRAEQEKQRADRLAEKLRELGVNLDEL